MKLIMSIVHSDDAADLLDALIEKGHRATKISTMGGFLQEGNATILVGAAEENVRAVLSIIKANCHARTVLVNPLPFMLAQEPLILQPIEVEVGGATVFILNVEEFWRF